MEEEDAVDSVALLSSIVRSREASNERYRKRKFEETVTVKDVESALFHTRFLDSSGEIEHRRCIEDFLYGLFFHWDWIYPNIGPVINYLKTAYHPHISKEEDVVELFNFLLQNAPSSSNNDCIPFMTFFLHAINEEEPIKRAVKQMCPPDRIDQFLPKLQERTEILRNSPFNEYNIEEALRKYVFNCMIDYMQGSQYVEKQRSIGSVSTSSATKKARFSSSWRPTGVRVRSALNRTA